jgi:hypothetical protein
VDLRVTCTLADFIIRATALDYAQKPDDRNSRTTGVPESKVAFRIEELLKGENLKSKIVLNGYLSQVDDFNKQAVPYSQVRPSGQHGSCYANTYKQGAQFLLFVKRSQEVKGVHASTPFTVNIDPLAPVNEQLHSSDDPWVYYIKGLLHGLNQSPANKESRR